MKKKTFKYVLYASIILCLLTPVITTSLSMKTLNISSESTRDGISDKDVEDSINKNEQKTLLTPKLSLTIAWEPNGTIISNENTDHQEWPEICSAEVGSAIIAWSDGRNGNSDIYAQKIDSTGHTQWGDGSYWGGLEDRNGTVICNSILHQGAYDNLQICSDGAGGAIITWGDKRNGDWDIYAQKINSTGHTQWGDGSYWGGLEDRNGTVICNSIGNQGAGFNDGNIDNIQICSDGKRGAIITWEDKRNGNFDVYAQWVNSTGHTQLGDGSYWGGLEDRNGTAICNRAGDQQKPQICATEVGSAIITWDDLRIGSDKNIYAQRINSTGHTQWGDGSYFGGLEDRNGTVICNASKSQSDAQICSDYTGGAIITWEDQRNGNADIYAQKINSTGHTQWGDGSYWGGLEDRNGTVICNEASSNQAWPQMCSDEVGGAIIAWHDDRNGDGDIYAQKINSNGQIQWTANGTIVSNEDTTEQWNLEICSDVYGGAIITWDHQGVDIYVQKISSDETAEWANGTVICNANSGQYAPKICSDYTGGAIMTWEDSRSVTNIDLYAQRIKGSGGAPSGLPAADDDDDDDDEPAIPYGNYYLGFAAFAVVALIVIMKRKTIFTNKK